MKYRFIIQWDQEADDEDHAANIMDEMMGEIVRPGDSDDEDHNRQERTVVMTDVQQLPREAQSG
jgi:hypothetical protein